MRRLTAAFFVLLLVGACRPASEGDVANAQDVPPLRDSDTLSNGDLGEICTLDADVFADAADLDSVTDDVGPADIDSEDGEPWDGKAHPDLLLCGEGFVDCVEVWKIQAPYLRHRGWLRIGTDLPASVPVDLSVALNGAPFPCAPPSCDLEFATSAYGEGLKVDVAVRFGPDHAQSEARTWTLPIFDCDLPEGKQLCIDFGAWEPQEPVLEDPGDLIFQGWDVAQRSDGVFAAGLMVEAAAEGEDSRLLLAVSGEGGWTRSQVSSWNDETRPGGVSSSGGLALEYVGDELRLAYHTMVGKEGLGGLHVDQVTAEGSLDPLLFLPGWDNGYGQEVQCGHDLFGVPRYIFNTGLAHDTDGSPVVLFHHQSLYFMIAKGDGVWRCDVVTGTDLTGVARVVGSIGGQIFASARVLSETGGAVHAAMGNYLGSFYQKYSHGAWSDSLFVEGEPPVPQVRYALNAIAPAPAGGVDHAYFVGQADPSGLAFGVRRIRDGKVVNSSEESLATALVETFVSSGGAYDVGIGAMGLEVRDDACGRTHVLLIEIDNLDDPSAVYAFSTLRGSWRGEWFPEIQPGVRLQDGNLPSRSPFFFDAQGRQHLFYATFRKYNDPPGTPTRLMHWVRPCEVYLTE